jgi:tyrosinase
MNGEELSVDHTPGFQIAVLWAEVVPAACADEFPKMKGEYQVLANATSERVGGFREGDTL